MKNYTKSTMSKDIKQIMVPLDGSKNSIRALDKAIQIARECHATITAVYARTLLVSAPRAFFLYPTQIIDSFEKAAKKIFADAKLRAAKKGVLLKYKMIKGDDPAYDIVNFSNKRKQFDMIVIGNRGRGMAKEVLFGSVSHYVVHKAKAPVLVVK